jgi:hypothetical protein
MKLLVFTCLETKNKQDIHELVANTEEVLRQSFFGGEKVCTTFFHTCSNTKENNRLCEALKKNGTKVILFTKFCGEKRFNNVRKTISKTVGIETVHFITTDPGLKATDVPIIQFDQIGEYLKELRKTQKEPVLA